MRTLGQGAVILFGFGVALLTALRGVLPASSVLVVEEPDVVRKRDLETVALDLPMVAEIVRCEYQVRERLERLLTEDDRLSRARAVLNSIEYGVEAAAIAADRFGLPGAGAEAARLFRDKREIRRLAARAGLRNPRHSSVSSAEEAVAFFENAGRPCVLKPTSRHASLGVHVVTSASDIREGWAITSRVDEGRHVPDRGVPSGILIEELVAGPEYSVELLVSAGAVLFANVTAKAVLPGRFPVEIGHVVPAPIDPALADRLVADTVRLVSAAGFGSGSLHAEWIVDADGPVLVECAARLAGDQITSLISLAYGFPMVETYVAVLLGERPAVPSRAVAAAAVRFVATGPGTVTAVGGLEEASALPGVQAAVISVGPGSRVNEVRSSWDRAGYVVARSATPADAAGIAERAAGMISVTIAREAPSGRVRR